MKLKDILTMIGITFFTYTLWYMILITISIHLGGMIITGTVIIVIGIIAILLDAIVIYLKKNWLKIVKVNKGESK